MSIEDEQDASLARVEAGGITLAAEQRLTELGQGAGAFTSDLSVADFALCHKLGLRALAQVMGSSIYQVGYQTAPWSQGLAGTFMFEMEELSEAWNEVRRRALNRLAEEAQLVDADAVIGVQLNAGERDWAESSIEYTVIGTAVRHESQSRRASAPVLTELSVADYTKLREADVEPLGIVAWSSVFFVASSAAVQMLRSLSFTENQELSEYTEAVYSARESVIRRMTEQSTRLDASGVIGVRINHNVRPMDIGAGTYSRSGLMVSFHAIGTAIRESASAAPPYPPETTIDLTL